MVYALIAAFILLTIFVESNWFGWALIELLVIGAVAYAAARWAWITLPAVDVRDIVFFGCGYLLAGVVWSFIRWLLFILNFKLELTLEIAEIKKSGYINDEMSQAEYKRSLLTHLPHQYRYPPTAYHHSGKIMGWIGFWPCSVAGFVFRNPVKRIFLLLKSSYQRIADSLLSNAYEGGVVVKVESVNESSTKSG